VLIWEVVTSGKLPHENIDLAELSINIRDNAYKLKIPKNCPASLRELMKKCWNKTPNNRPEFEEIKKLLADNPIEQGM